MTNQTNLPRVPVFVIVQGSESGDFQENSLFTFDEFEQKARRVARNHGRGGYLKTWVNVLFADGNSYELRLDLAEGDTHGFRHAVELRLRHWDCSTTKECPEALRAHYAELHEFLQGIEFKAAA